MLEEIKMLHQQANDLYAEGSEEEAYELVKQLFLEEFTDWLIEQADKVERLEKEKAEAYQAGYKLGMFDESMDNF